MPKAKISRNPQFTVDAANEMHRIAMLAPPFAHLTDEELKFELEAQRELMGGYEKAMKHNPYYNPAKGLARLEELEREYRTRHST